MFDAIFLRHPRSIGETYFEHATAALGFAAQLFAASMACLTHAIVPALFQRTASRTVVALHARMVANRRRAPADANEFDYAI